MDAKPLPARPSLEQYKKQAKELVRAFRAEQSLKSSDSQAIQRKVKSKEKREKGNPRCSKLWIQ